MAVSSWFVEVTKFKDRMIELNEQITWVPEHVKHGQFGKWLENARDWSISRNRFWGSPIPVWKSDNPEHPRIDVYGSFEELERDFGVEVTDLHRPFIDRLTRPNPDDPTGNSTMRRVEDVLDVWFDSGSMSFAQVHYPFENADWFEHHFPGDFIVEYIGQTRGWFYTLHILATALFDRPAFSSCVSHGIVLGSDGQKMSKSLRNYPDVREVFNRDGADAMRWFLMSSPILRGGNLVVTEQGIRDGVRQVLIPLWNSWYFFSLYANAANGGKGYEAKWSTGSTDVLDRYLLAKLREYVETAQGQLDVYDIAGACDSTRSFLDVLTNWYIRRSRDRFWDTAGADTAVSQAAFDTLYTALEVVCRVAAPLLPLTTEEIWRGLTGGRSVHLTDWPDASDLPADHSLVAAMDKARDICSTASSLRKAKSLRVRLPLNDLTVVTANAASLREFGAIVADEVNVRTVTLRDVSEASEADFGVSQRLTVNARAAGPRLGRDVQQAIKGSKSGDWSVAGDGAVTAGGLALQEGEYTLETVVDDSVAGGARATAMLPGRRLRRARHGGDARAGAGGAGPRHRPRRAAGPARRRPGRQRPDQPDRDGWPARLGGHRGPPGAHRRGDAGRAVRLGSPAGGAPLARRRRRDGRRRRAARAHQGDEALMAGTGKSGRPDAAQQEAAHNLDVMKRMRLAEEAILARAPEHDLEPSLDRIAAVMELLGEPQRTFPVIHLTGTNGKTSTTRIIDSLLREMGLKTGRFTSPHLHTIRERIALSGVPISAEKFLAAYDEVLPFIEMVDARSAAEGGPRMTFFEVLVAVAYAAFADAPVDVAIIEVGMGGGWDATNVADGSVAVVTPIAIDHQHFLGNDVLDIAAEKAGIIKADAVAVVGVQEPEVARTLADRAAEVGARIAFEGNDFGLLTREVAVGGQQLSVRGLTGDYTDLFIPLHGAHQAHNTVTALAAVEAFLGGGERRLDPEIVRAGLAAAASPGRLEIVRRSPTVIVDAAHNAAGRPGPAGRPRGLLQLRAHRRCHRDPQGQGRHRDARDPRAGARPRRRLPHHLAPGPASRQTSASWRSTSSARTG